MYYLQKIIQVIRGKRIRECIKKRLYFFIFPFFDWIGIRIRGQNEYSLKNLNDGLRHKKQLEDHISDNDVLKIIESYLKEKKDQSYQPELYQVSGLWEKILIDVHQKLKTALENKDVDKVKLILSNFGRDEISIGLLLYGGWPHTFLDKIRSVNCMNRANYAWKKITKLPENALEYPKDIGNLFGVEVNGKLIIVPAHRLSYFAQRISNLLEEEHPVIVEIGPGFGGIPYHLFKYFNSNYTYIGFEIPEVAVITKYFLKSVFPNKKFLFYNDSKIENINLKEYDIILMPYYEVKNLPNMCSDLVFNSHSLVEMESSTVKEYLVQINRICKKYFLHANHELQDKYGIFKGRIQTSVDLSQSEFELPRKTFRRIYRTPEVLTNINHYNFEEYAYYEYLYERRLRLKNKL